MWSKSIRKKDLPHLNFGDSKSKQKSNIIKCLSQFYIGFRRVPVERKGEVLLAKSLLSFSEMVQRWKF